MALRTDDLIVEFDRALRTLWGSARSDRALPGGDAPMANLDEQEVRCAQGLMRVNHTGEVCAQALYQGQALTSRDPSVRSALRQAAHEEIEHLAWTEARISELGGRTSLLNPVWYLGSLTMGIAAGLLGDKWNLGFLVETERQVEKHLDSHLHRLPAEDLRSRAIVAQMREDEIAHADLALSLGAATLPPPVKFVMRGVAKVMTGTAYHV